MNPPSGCQMTPSTATEWLSSTNITYNSHNVELSPTNKPLHCPTGRPKLNKEQDFMQPLKSQHQNRSPQTNLQTVLCHFSINTLFPGVSDSAGRKALRRVGQLRWRTSMHCFQSCGSHGGILIPKAPGFKTRHDALLVLENLQASTIFLLSGLEFPC